MYKVWECELCEAVEKGAFLPDGWLRIPQPNCKRDVYCPTCLERFPTGLLPESDVDGTILIVDQDSLWGHGDVVTRQRLRVQPLDDGFVHVISWEDDSMWVGV